MRVRLFELRILGVVLTGLWVAAFALITVGYRPGGPVDLAVGLAAIGPMLIAGAAVAWPPAARGDRAFAAIVWLGLVAILLLVPSLLGIAQQIRGRGPQTLLPSVEAGYPWLLALVATSLYAGLGIARHRLGETALRRRRLLLGSAIGLLLVLLAGTAFTATAVVNELALGGRAAVVSRFGPTDPTIEPPSCGDELAAGATARVTLTMDAAIDDRRSGQVSIDGVRDGADVRWQGFAATRFTLGQHGFARVGDEAWLLRPGRWWSAASSVEVTGRDLDRQLVAVALAPANRVAAEDRGLAYVEGARARHCRIAFDGLTLRSALPMIDLLVGDTDIDRWRGELDYWVFADGQLGQADGRLNGPAIELAEDALLATIRFRLTSTDRGRPTTVRPPVR